MQTEKSTNKNEIVVTNMSDTWVQTYNTQGMSLSSADDDHGPILSCTRSISAPGKSKRMRLKEHTTLPKVSMIWRTTVFELFFLFDTSPPIPLGQNKIAQAIPNALRTLPLDPVHCSNYDRREERGVWMIWRMS